MKTMRLLLSVFLPRVILGCQSSDKIAAADHTPAVGDSVAQARGHVASADAATERAKPDADTTGKEFLDAAHDEHGKADAKLVDAQSALAQIRADEAAKAAEVVRQKALLDVYHDRWTGDKFQRVLVRALSPASSRPSGSRWWLSRSPLGWWLARQLDRRLGPCRPDRWHGRRKRHHRPGQLARRPLSSQIHRIAQLGSLRRITCAA